MSTAEHLRFWADFYGTGAGGAIDRVADALGLEPLLDRAVGELSAGQRRRLGIARIVASGRRDWLLDEPATALDAWSRARFTEVLASHLADGGRAVFADHSSGNMDGFPSLDISAFARTAPCGASSGSDGFDEGGS